MASPIHTFRADALADHDAVELARRVRAREVSAAELVEAAIARARAAGPLAAIVIDAFEQAREQAERLDREHALAGAFAGVPTFLKDQIDTIGLPTRYGSEAHADAAPATRNDPITIQFAAMGLITLGKSTLPEYGLVPSTEFPRGEPTRNPWNLARTPGGSSGGAAALVAAGVVPIAHTADGGGSTRVPAACCGLVGMKPTRGRLPDSGMQDPFVRITTDGVVSRSVRDTALYYAEAERLRPNRRLAPIGHVQRGVDRALRIGAVERSPLGTSLDAPTRQALAQTLDLLSSLGHRVEVMPAPIGQEFADDFLAFWAMLAGLIALTSKYRNDPRFDRTRLTRFTRELGEHARASVARLPGVVHRLRRSARHAARVFEGIDVIVSPTVGSIAPPLGHLSMDQSFEALYPKLFEWVCFTPWANAAGIPALSLPLGFDDETGLPVGVMFCAAHGGERVLLELGLQLEQAAAFRRLGAGEAVHGQV